MKLTEDPGKQTLPGSKAAYRLLRADGEARPTPPTPPWSSSSPQAPRVILGTHSGSPLLDVLQLAEEQPPQAGRELRVWPRGAQEAWTVKPARVEPLLRLWVQRGQVASSSSLSLLLQPRWSPGPWSLTLTADPTLAFPLPSSCVSPSHLWPNREPSPSCP